jgi:FKBP-type peptidyl-prolyl cis-trans isomerase
VKKTRAVASIAAVVATMSLGACSSGSVAAPSPTRDDAAALASIQWTSGSDGAPVVTFDTPFVVRSDASRVVEDGDGDEITEGQLVALDYVAFSGDDGSVLYSTYDLGRPEAFVLEQSAMAPSLWSALSGSHVGAKFLFVTPDTATADGGTLSSLVGAFTVVGASDVLDRATGEAIPQSAGLPIVTLADDGEPSIDFAGATRPDGLYVQTLIAGDGDLVAEGQSVTVRYTGWLWDGEQFDTTWGGEPLTAPLVHGGLIDGWVLGLAGKNVGSQVLLIVPPELGYGDLPYGPIPANSTLVFVVDILAAV